jgi:hypothetical protein
MAFTLTQYREWDNGLTDRAIQDAAEYYTEYINSQEPPIFNNQRYARGVYTTNQSKPVEIYKLMKVFNILEPSGIFFHYTIRTMKNGRLRVQYSMTQIRPLYQNVRDPNQTPPQPEPQQ